MQARTVWEGNVEVFIFIFKNNGNLLKGFKSKEEYDQLIIENSFGLNVDKKWERSEKLTINNGSLQ